LKSLLFKVSYAKADKYIVLGNIFKEKLLQLGVPYKNQFFIETTVADSKYLKEFDLNCKLSTYKKEVHFVFLSRIEKEKGIYIAIDAFRKFTENNPERPSKLVIAGDGPDLPAVKKYIETNKIVNIILLGHVHAETKRKVLFESHVMIFPSFTEGLPNVILEGMLYGMPIISRAVGGIPEVVKEGINGFLTSSFDSNIFEGFLSKIANDLDLYKTIAIKNHEIGMKRFTSEKVKERILQIIGNSEILNK
jgi:glycosyltransferase involved in cell wall biosynthesis